MPTLSAIRAPTSVPDFMPARRPAGRVSTGATSFVCSRVSFRAVAASAASRIPPRHRARSRRHCRAGMRFQEKGIVETGFLPRAQACAVIALTVEHIPVNPVTRRA